jgi:PST family polysaccharide transporter
LGRPVITAEETQTSVAGRAAAGVAWNFAAGLSAKALGLLGTLVLTRFVAPAEFGEVSVAVVVVETATQFSNYNLGSFVVTRRTEPGPTFQALAYHMSGMAIACLLVTLFRHPIADALGAPGAAAYIPWLALANLVLQLSRIPEATLYRALQFRPLALTRALGEIAYTVVSVGLAPLLRGGAIVAGNLARSLTLTTAILARSRKVEWLQPTALQFSTAREMLRFGFPLSMRTLADKLSRSWDNLLVSRLFGNHVMGQYALAYNLADVTGQVSEYISDVLLPSLSRLDPARQKLALPRITAMMGLVLFPIIAGLAVVAPLAVDALLAAEWASVAPMLAILCFRSFPVPIVSVLAAYFAARGRTEPIMYLGILRLGLVLGLLLTVGRMGPLWACVAVVLAYNLASLAHLFVGWWLEQLPIRPFIGAILRPLAASGLMAAGVLAFRATVEVWIPMPVSLALGLEIGVGGLAYVAAVFLVARSTAGEFLAAVSGVMARKTA